MLITILVRRHLISIKSNGKTVNMKFVVNALVSVESYIEKI